MASGEASQTSESFSDSPLHADNMSTFTKGGRPFRVIIAGAGVAGLVLSHALERAGIEHIVLEKGVVAPEWGASVSIWANGARILKQISCWDALLAASSPLQKIYVRGSNGKAYSDEPYFDMMLERNGFDYITMERKDFLRIIYEKHPNKDRIRTRTRVVDVADEIDGVKVVLQDGSCERGDILLGCDGVHSAVRELMWRNANLSVPDHISAREKTSLVTTYRALVGVAKPLPGLGTRDMHWVTRHGLSVLILTQPDKTFFFVNWKMPQQIRWPTKAKWDNEAAQKAADSVADMFVTESVVFGEIWSNRSRAHLIGLQEGTFDHWHFGRVALMGDSVHKLTPNFALGAMCALEDCAVLVNEIHQIHTTLSEEQRPTKDAVSSMFQRYEEKRKPRQKEASDASALLTRLHAYDGWSKWIIMRWIIPAVGMTFLADVMADLCAGAPKISFLPVKYDRPAAYKWKDEPGNVVVQSKHEQPSTTLRVVSSNNTVTDVASVLIILLILYFSFAFSLEDVGLALNTESTASMLS